LTFDGVLSGITSFLGAGVSFSADFCLASPGAVAVTGGILAGGLYGSGSDNRF
jgi:hypothetical protein